MIKLLILAADITEGRRLADSLGITNLHIMDEISIREAIGFTMDPDLPGYGSKIVDKIVSLVNSYKAARPLAIIVDMRHHDAVDKIPHDISCLLYDGSRNRRLSYNPRYKTKYQVKDPDDSRLGELIVDFSSRIPL